MEDPNLKNFFWSEKNIQLYKVFTITEFQFHFKILKFNIAKPIWRNILHKCDVMKILRSDLNPVAQKPYETEFYVNQNGF